MRKYIVEPGRLQTTPWLMRIARWILKAANTHSQYVINTACPLQRTRLFVRLHVQYNAALVYVTPGLEWLL